MKKIRNLLISFALIICATTLFVGCSTKLAGKTYAFEKASCTINSELTEEQKASIINNTSFETIDELVQSYVDDLTENFTGTTVQFGKDGTMKFLHGQDSTDLYYTQDGNKISVFEDAEKTISVTTEDSYYQIEDGKLVQIYNEYTGSNNETLAYTMKIYFKKA